MTTLPRTPLVGEPDMHGQERWPTPERVEFGVAEVEASSTPAARGPRSEIRRVLTSLAAVTVAQQVLWAETAGRTLATDAFVAGVLAVFASLWVAWRTRRSGSLRQPMWALAGGFLTVFLVERAGAWLL